MFRVWRCKLHTARSQLTLRAQRSCTGRPLLSSWRPTNSQLGCPGYWGPLNAGCLIGDHQVTDLAQTWKLRPGGEA